jgi:ribosomal protein L7/L12
VSKRLKEVEVLAVPRTKIKAIKKYRQITGTGLKEAKDAVEFFMANQTWEESDSSFQEVRSLIPVEALAVPKTKIKAIKKYRQITGTGLKEAKDAVEFFMANQTWRESEAQVNNETSFEPDDALYEPETIQKTINETSRFPQAMNHLLQSIEDNKNLIAEVETTYNLEKGILFLSHTDLFFCQKDFNEWSHSKTWTLTDIIDFKVTTSFMDTEMVLIIQEGSVRFSDLHTEDSQDFIALLKQIIPREDQESENQSTYPENTIDDGYQSDPPIKKSQNSLWSLLIFIVIVLFMLELLIDSF